MNGNRFRTSQTHNRDIINILLISLSRSVLQVTDLSFSPTIYDPRRLGHKSKEKKLDRSVTYRTDLKFSPQLVRGMYNARTRGWNFKFVAKEVVPLCNCYCNVIYAITAFDNYKITRKHSNMQLQFRRFGFLKSEQLMSRLSSFKFFVDWELNRPFEFVFPVERHTRSCQKRDI